MICFRWSFIFIFMVFNLQANWSENQGNGFTAFAQDGWNAHDPLGLSTVDMAVSAISLQEIVNPIPYVNDKGELGQFDPFQKDGFTSESQLTTTQQLYIAAVPTAVATGTAVALVGPSILSAYLAARAKHLAHLASQGRGTFFGRFFHYSEVVKTALTWIGTGYGADYLLGRMGIDLFFSPPFEEIPEFSDEKVKESVESSVGNKVEICGVAGDDHWRFSPLAAGLPEIFSERGASSHQKTGSLYIPFYLSESKCSSLATEHAKEGRYSVIYRTSIEPDLMISAQDPEDPGKYYVEALSLISTGTTFVRSPTR